MILECLEARRLFSADLYMNVDSSHLAGSVPAGQVAKGTIWITIIDDTSDAVPKKNIPKLDASLTLTGDVADASGNYPTIVVTPGRFINVAGMKSEQKRVLKLKVKIPATAESEDYMWLTNPKNTAAFSAVGITVNGSQDDGVQADPLTVTFAPSAADAVVAQSLTAPGGSGNAVLTLKNPTKRMLSGKVPFELFAATPGQRNLPLDPGGANLDLSYLVGSVQTQVSKLKPGKTIQVPVNISLSFFPLPFAYTFELFAVESASPDVDGSTSTAPGLVDVIIPASSSASAATVLTIAPDSTVTAPIQTVFIENYRPTSIEYNSLSFFVDADNEEGIIDSFGIYFQGGTYESVFLSTTHA